MLAAFTHERLSLRSRYFAATLLPQRTEHEVTLKRWLAFMYLRDAADEELPTEHVSGVNST